MIAGAVVEMGDLSVLWWLLLVPVAAVGFGLGTFAVLKLIDRIMLEAFKGIWR